MGWALWAFSIAGQFSDENILEVKRIPVVLQFDRSGGIDGLVAFPVVLHNHIVHNQLVV